MHAKGVSMVRQMVVTAFLFKGKVGNKPEDTELLRFFKTKPLYKGTLRVKEITCCIAPPGWKKVNKDGAARGQPREASCGRTLPDVLEVL